MSEFNEPWRSEGVQVGRDALQMAICSDSRMAERIAACINFCQGITTEFLNEMPLVDRPYGASQYVKPFNCADALEIRDKLRQSPQPDDSMEKPQ